MAKRTVVWTRTADLQFVGVLAYWAKRNHSSTYSKKLMQSVAEVLQQVALTPLMYRLAEYKDFRVVTLENFSIYYRVLESQIVVVAFWDNRQDPKKLLKILEEKGS